MENVSADVSLETVALDLMAHVNEWVVCRESTQNDSRVALDPSQVRWEDTPTLMAGARLRSSQSPHDLRAPRCEELSEPVAKSRTDPDGSTSITEVGENRPSVASTQRPTAVAFSLQKGPELA